MTKQTAIPLMTDEDAPPRVRELFDRIRGAIGFVPNLFRLWAQAPHLVDTLVQLETTIAGTGKIRADLKELAMLRTSELNGCPYCKAFHGANVKDLGVAEAKTAALKERSLPTPSLFSEEELAVLQLTDEMTLDVQAKPETLERVRGLFGLDGAVELMAVIALLNFDNRMAFTANVPVDDR